MTHPNGIPDLEPLLRHEILPREEERRLLIAAKAGDRAARDRLVECNLRLVAKNVYAFTRRGLGVEKEDLMSVGVIGLIEAIDRFDLSREGKLSTYATFYIRVRMRNEAETARVIKQPNQWQLHQESGEKCREKAKATSNIAWLSDSLDAMRVMADKRTPRPWAVAAENDDRARALAVLQGLKPSMRDCLTLTFGLDGRGPRKCREAGRELGVSPQAVSQQVIAGLAKLRLDREGGSAAVPRARRWTKPRVSVRLEVDMRALRALVTRAGTVSRAARLAGVGEKAVKEWFKTDKRPSTGALLKLCAALGVPPGLIAPRLARSVIANRETA